MKISNPDIIRLAEIKSYFLDPPYTFRIYSYAKPQVDEAINILSKYSISPALMGQMEDLRQLFEQSENDANATRENMRSFAILLNRVNR
ncbi:hypothetical protein [Chitinophaga filiformis]|uniref:Uncharacterized protein n=1 Tax=Chitinophaga filiformis TaxID=104663 RepID=A0ABY4I8W7_CHIFI|nr:hypothetical protein [Chitinophaga filiformis]UPK72531.1 hypothetical protein MYF79_14660 [Chitinophaga filiformis]